MAILCQTDRSFSGLNNPQPRIRAALLLTGRGNKLLLIQQEKNGERYWLAPGGGVNYGETIVDALSRELEEELNIHTLDIGRLCLMHESIAPDKSRHIVNVYFEGNTEDTPVLGGEPNLVDMGYFSSAEILQMDIRPPVNHLLAAYLDGTLNQMDSVYTGTYWK